MTEPYDKRKMELERKTELASYSSIWMINFHFYSSCLHIIDLFHFDKREFDPLK
jgi:hypothetical protein